MENKSTPKLTLRKEVITQLNDEQLMTFVGGVEDALTNSCGDTSCNSQHNAGSCNGSSCNCP